MERIYRYVLVAVMIALISWGAWYVISHYQEQSTYEDGVLVLGKVEDMVTETEIWENLHNVKQMRVDTWENLHNVKQMRVDTWENLQDMKQVETENKKTGRK